MKSIKNVLLLLTFVVATTASFGQNVSFGVKGGLNFSNIDVKQPGATYESRSGWHGGAFMLMKFGQVGIQPEVIFSKQGSSVKYSTSKNVDSNFDYLNIPVIIKLYTVGGINLQVGPRFGFLTNEPEVKDPYTNEYIKNAYKKSDVSLALGVGWDTPIGLNLDFRYNLGLTEINDSASLNAAKNQVWQVSAGFRLFKFGDNK